jgi:hypothetical protein
MALLATRASYPISLACFPSDYPKVSWNKICNFRVLYWSCYNFPGLCCFPYLIISVWRQREIVYETNWMFCLFCALHLWWLENIFLLYSSVLWITRNSMKQTNQRMNTPCKLKWRWGDWANKHLLLPDIRLRLIVYIVFAWWFDSLLTDHIFYKTSTMVSDVK